MLKVEKPGRGDGIRHAGRRPPELGSLNFVGLNRNKRGITIDIGQEAGCALVRRLAAKADVVLENFRPGVMERHGIGWEQLRALNPRLVYCSITAFGPRGPLAQKPGMDLIIQANRLQGGPRKVTSITEEMGMEQDMIIMQEIFRYRQLGIDQNGRSYGQFEATGVRPSFVNRLEASGIKLPSNLFQERVLLRD